MLGDKHPMCGKLGGSVCKMQWYLSNLDHWNEDIDKQDTFILSELVSIY